MFEPNYENLVKSARNIEVERIPLYEHFVSYSKIGEIVGTDMDALFAGDDRDLAEFFRIYCGFFRDHGYDAVPFELCVGQVMPGAGALGDSRVTPVIQDAEDFARYPWAEIPDIYFGRYARIFRALGDAMPAGMKAVGGVGNGIFECVQDLVGYQNLCYLMDEDPDLFAAMFRKVGETNLEIWRRFLPAFGDTYCVLRFGDDLGYYASTLLSPEDLRTHVFPRYKPIVDLVHSTGKPFLLHSCGSIFSVMDDLIDDVGIDAKHSNEDKIAPFSRWVELYGSRIGNFGGADMDVMCRTSGPALREYILEILRSARGHGGFAFSTGNSIPDYVPAENYLEMIQIVREFRGDFRS